MCFNISIYENKCIIINSFDNNKLIMKIKSDLVIVCCGLTLLSELEKKNEKKSKGF